VLEDEYEYEYRVPAGEYEYVRGLLCRPVPARPTSVRYRGRSVGWSTPVRVHSTSTQYEEPSKAYCAAVLSRPVPSRGTGRNGNRRTVQYSTARRQYRYCVLFTPPLPSPSSQYRTELSTSGITY
jgi:hypothetical protein